MASVFDVAKYISETCGKFLVWKLQILCYYCQAWTLAWDGRELFSEDFEAWIEGPVCRELYERQVFINDLDSGNIENLSEDDRENIDVVLDSYSRKDSYWLKEQVRGEAPWKEARKENCNNIIPKGYIASYYREIWFIDSN